MIDAAELIMVLGSPTTAAREAAKTQLLSMGDSAVEPLIAAVAEQESRKCYEAALVLQMLGDRRALDVMIRALETTHPLLGYVALDMVQTFAPPNLGTILITALPNSRPALQLLIIKALLTIHDAAQVDVFMALLQKADAPSLRYTLIDALGRLGDPRAAGLIVQFADDDDHHVRAHVVDALARLGTPPEKPKRTQESP